MIRFTLILLIAFSLVITSCGSRRSKFDRKNLIPEKELVPILTDIYLTDGLIGMPRITMKYSPFDSVTTYNYVIEKHGYKKEALDKTLRYYFIKKPKELIKIYDKVLSILSVMESRVNKDAAKMKTKPGSLWTGQEFYAFPDPDGTDSASFDINMNKPGFYTLNAMITIYPDDLSLNPGLITYSAHPDSILTGKRAYYNPVRFLKDGHPHRYSVIFNHKSKDPRIVRGSLYEYENKPDDWQKHIFVQNISVTFNMVEI